MRQLVAIAIAAAGCGSCGHSSAGGDAPACSAEPAPESGDGTYYAADGTGNCSFDASPDDLMVAAMNGADYANAAWCGACLEVSHGTTSIVVRVVDQCPGCQHGDLDLSEQAFAMLAPTSAGRIPITWHEVACPVTGPVQYRFKEGSNAYWIAIQLRDHRYPISKLEARTGAGAWTEIARADYNYFVDASGLGTGPVALRVTDTRGHAIEDDAVPFAAATIAPSAQQFPRCP